jgi:hypothetical protein
MKVLYKIPFFLLLISLSSCDPAYEYIIYNKNEDCKLEIYPSLESLSKNSETVKEFIKTHKISNDSPFVYNLNKGEKVRVFGGLGIGTSLSKFPIQYFKITTSSDSLLFTDKKQIMSKFKNKNNKKYIFEL